MSGMAPVAIGVLFTRQSVTLRAIQQKRAAVQHKQTMAHAHRC
jgi:hypothetical protein